MNYRNFFVSQIILLALPSILLSSFAIYAILGEKTVILKKIEETYDHLVTSTQRRIVEKLREKEKLIYAKIKKFESEEITVENLAILDPLYPYVFIVKENKIVYPQHRPQIFSSEAPQVISEYHKFHTAHVYEFQEKNYLLAIEEYKTISKNKNLDFLGIALVAIARCYKKNNNYSNALDSYNNIITLFAEPSNLSEFKLVMNAKIEIIEIKKYQQNIKNSYEDVLIMFEHLIFNEMRVPKYLYSYYYNKIENYINQIKDHQELNVEVKENLLRQYRDILNEYEKKQQQEKLLLESQVLLEYLAREKRNSGYFKYIEQNVEQLAYYQIFSEGVVVYKMVIAELINVIMPTMELQIADNNDFVIALIDENKKPLIPQFLDKNAHLVTQKLITESYPFWSIAVYTKHDDSLESLTLRKSYLYFGGIFFIIILLFMGLYIFITSFIREIRNSRLQSDFVSNVTHEFKTPLTSIKMFVETLIMGRVKSDKERLEYLNIISSESDRLSRLIDRILDFAKMKENKRNFHFAQEDMRKILKNIISEFSQKTPDCIITLKSEENLPTVQVDVDAITEAIMNLLSNAYKYTHKKPKEINIYCGRRKKFLEIKIKDKGIGIPKQEQQRIFQKFYRVEDSKSKQVEGTGLGLSLVLSIMGAHNGKINVNSKVGVGSEFIMSLPLH